ncbi:hypothetical protein Dimus_019046 [Dionaea muscipula]
MVVSASSSSLGREGNSDGPFPGWTAQLLPIIRVGSWALNGPLSLKRNNEVEVGGGIGKGEGEGEGKGKGKGIDFLRKVEEIAEMVDMIFIFFFVFLFVRSS